MGYSPLPKSDLERIENDFEDILSECHHPWLEGALRESRVHFILRSFGGFLNYDIDNIFIRPENQWKSLVFSIKDRLHKIDFVYRKYPSDYLCQLTFNEDYTEFQVANDSQEIAFRGNRKELEKWIQTILFEEPKPILVGDII